MGDRYELHEVLGGGASATVFRALDRHTGLQVAVKRIESVTPEAVAAAEQELSSMRASSRSPHCISLLDHFVHDSHIWIVLELCEPGSLADFLTLPPLISDCVCRSEEMISYILLAILEALAFLHDRARIHRDVKASNVLLTASGRVKLGDLGIAAALTTAHPLRNTVAGSPLWMAPEVIVKSGYSEPADVWSLGITAIEIAQRAPPYSDEHPLSALFLIPQAPAPRLSAPGMWSTHFNDFVASCLQKESAARPSAKALLTHRFFDASHSRQDSLRDSLRDGIASAMPLILKRRTPLQPEAPYQTPQSPSTCLSLNHGIPSNPPLVQLDSDVSSSSSSIIYAPEAAEQPANNENHLTYQRYVSQLQADCDRRSKKGFDHPFGDLEIALADDDSSIDSPHGRKAGCSSRRRDSASAPSLEIPHAKKYGCKSD